MKIIADDYKGKWFILQDENIPANFTRKEINTEYVMNEGLMEHVENCLYYGIPAYIGQDQELLDKIEILEEEINKKDEEN